jgi:hypothetical protein
VTVTNSLRQATRPFAASFSSEGDLLPQWRSYCPNGNGVSIGFRTDCLKAAAVTVPKATGTAWRDQAPGVTFGKVAYMHEAQTSAIDEAIVEAAKAAVTSAIESRESDGDAATSASDFFISTMEEKACFTKDQSFSNEQEYRLLVSPLYLPIRYSFLEFRASRTTLIPYVSVMIPPHSAQPLPRSLFDRLCSRSDRTDFIDSIVIGPAPTSALSTDAGVPLVQTFYGNTGDQIKSAVQGPVVFSRRQDASLARLFLLLIAGQHGGFEWSGSSEAKLTQPLELDPKIKIAAQSRLEQDE